MKAIGSSTKENFRWGELTDDEFDMIAGKRDQLIGKLQEKYGFSRDRAEKEADEFGRTIH